MLLRLDVYNNDKMLISMMEREVGRLQDFLTAKLPQEIIREGLDQIGATVVIKRVL